MNKPFWLIWNPEGRAPTVPHRSISGARREAERLARAHRGQKFIVLESVEQCSVDDVVRVDMRPQPDQLDDEIPF
jgi:hypothetical protein